MAKNFEKSSENSSNNGQEWLNLADEMEADNRRIEEHLHKKDAVEFLGKTRADLFAKRAAVEKAYESKSTNPKEQKEVSLMEQMRRESEREWLDTSGDRDNEMIYGANISSAAAINGFKSEYFALQRKIEKDAREREKEEAMSPKERIKSERKRNKRGEIVSPEEREHFYKLQQIWELGGDGEKEQYGRKKERAFRGVQENMKADKRRFKKILRQRGLTMPKKWDDASCSLEDFQRIDNLTSHLRQPK